MFEANLNENRFTADLYFNYNNYNIFVRLNMLITVLRQDFIIYSILYLVLKRNLF